MTHRWRNLATGILCVVAAAASSASAALPAWSPGINGAFVSAVARRGPGWVVATADKGLWQVADGQWTAMALPVDDTVKALAVDQQGRIWAGHGYHGVSVYDGSTWLNYDGDVGPLGHHVFAIAVQPTNGDVWIATELGLARYGIKSDTWTYFNRSNGLPADEASAFAFDAKGTLYVGLQCEGVAIAHPDTDYATWTHVEGPTRPPVEATGAGLPSALVNDLKVAHDGRVYVATVEGLAISADAGRTWSFVRGLDYVDKNQKRADGPPANAPTDRAAARLLQDDVRAIGEDAAGHLWLGYYRMGVAPFDPERPADETVNVDARVTFPKGAVAVDWVRSICFGDGASLAGTWGQGLVVQPSSDAATPVAKLPANKPLMPSEATIDPKAFAAMAKKLHDAHGPPVTAAFVGDDWLTRGDGVGRYGSQYVSFPFYGGNGWSQKYKVEFAVGPHNTNGGPYTWYDTNDSDEDRVLYLPNAFKRASGEWNDGAFGRKQYPPEFEGPDLWLTVTVPEGVHRLSLYFINYDGLDARNRFRDFLVEVKPADDTIEKANLAPALARTRVVDFYDGVYKQFMLTGGKYYVKVGRNHSFVAKLAAVFIDRMAGPAPDETDKLPQPFLDPGHWGAPPLVRPDNANNDLAAALTAWDDLNTHVGDASVVPGLLPLRMQIYAMARQSEADDGILNHLRWHTHEWTPEDRLEFCQQMDAGYERTAGNNPEIRKAPRKSMEEKFDARHP